MAKHVQNIRSNATVSGNAKQPTAAKLLYGEIAVNYGKDQELLFIKNDNNEIVSFPTSAAVVAYVNSITKNFANYAFEEGTANGAFSVTPSSSAGVQTPISVNVHGLSHLWGSNKVTTLANLPIDKQSITATLSGATTISLGSALPVGRFLNIRCVATANFTQQLPYTGAWYSRSGHSFVVENGDIFEMNIWCYEEGKYSIIVGDDWDGDRYAKDVAIEDVGNHYTSTNVEGALAELSGKQDAITDLATIRSGAAKGATAYQKPSNGIPATDLASAVQTSLGKADTALQTHQDISGKADKITVATSMPAGGFLPNVLYRLGEISGAVTFQLAAATEPYSEYMIEFSTGATAPTITWFAGVSWLGGEAPTINESKSYNISVLDNLAVIGEF